MGFRGLHRLARSRHGGVGSLLTFHRVVPSNGAAAFNPNAGICVRPEFLRQVIELLVREGIEIVHVEEVRRRLVEGDFSRRFVSLTFDDGYADTYDTVWPLCRELGVPFTVYVTTGLADGTAVSWWFGLERLVREHDRIVYEWDGERRELAAGETEEKQAAFSTLRFLLRRATPDQQRRLFEGFKRDHGVDFEAVSTQEALTLDMVAEMARDDLVEFGAHTVHHPSLREWPADLARRDMAESRQMLESFIGRPVRHFAYPFGFTASAGPEEFALAADVGFATATTARHGNLFPDHREHLHCLPRLPVDGGRQQLAYVRAMMSGAVAALLHPRQKVVTT